MAGIPLKDQAWNRRLYDSCKTTDDLRLTTGPGRYQLDVPPQACNACFAPEPTIRVQGWGAALNGTYAKTDVESDLFNIGRPTTRNTCNQYDPAKDKINKGGATPAKECSFPQTHSRLVDPPCTLRGMGWNRWEWLCDNPQEGILLPFDNLVTTRLASKDQYRPCIPRPLDSASVLPAPSAYGKPTPFEGLAVDGLTALNTATKRVISEFPRGEDVLPAAPTALYGIQPANVNPPSVALAHRR